MSSGRKWLALVAVLGVWLAWASPALAQEDTGGGLVPDPRDVPGDILDGGRPQEDPDHRRGERMWDRWRGNPPETGFCRVNNEDFSLGFINPKDEELGYLPCSPDAYYLTYVDTRGFIGKMSEMVSQPAQNTYEAAQKTALNSMASSVFVWHAKAMATTINVMNWAFGFNLVHEFRDPVEALTRALEKSVYRVLIEVVWGCAIGYGAYLSIVRDQVSNGVMIIIKSAVIGSFGFIMLRDPMYVVNKYQGVVNQATSWVFGLVGEITGDTEPGDVSPDGTVDDKPSNRWGAPEEGAPRSEKEAQQGEMSALSQLIWANYVHRPWLSMQLYSDYDPRAPDAQEKMDKSFELLDIKWPDDRRKWLCAEAGCSAFEGAPEESGGETTGAEPTTEDTGGDSGGGSEDEGTGAEPPPAFDAGGGS